MNKNVTFGAGYFCDTFLKDFAAHLFVGVLSRVARLFVFKPKIQIWEKFSGPQIGNVDIFYGHLEYFLEIWDIL
jgi:hypothetical protein